MFKGFSIFSFGGHFVQPSRTTLAILVEGHKRTISKKLFQNQATGQGGDVLLKIFLFLALVAILFNGAEPFEQF